jgi:hypothetical protein
VQTTDHNRATPAQPADIEVLRRVLRFQLRIAIAAAAALAFSVVLNLITGLALIVANNRCR